jgi:SAM-dependent methyltransferase
MDYPLYGNNMLTRLIKIGRIIGPHLPVTVWRIYMLLFYNPLLKVYAKYADWKELKLRESKNSSADMPPPSLRLRIGGGLSEMSRQTFVTIGKGLADDIENILQSQLKRNLSSFHDILDFGCGCGRALIWLYRLASKPKYHGTDIDEEAIEWCRNNLKFAEFSANKPFPPLDFRSEGFDFIYAISVFTHIDEEMQNAWIQELHRVLKPKGILLISVLGPNACKNMPKDITYRLESQGFVFVKLDFARGIFPNWYQLSYHTEGYVRQKFGKYFNLLSFMEKAVFGFQDVALLEKK